MWHSIKAVVQRDLKLVTRQGGDWLNPLSFFVMVITLFPLAISSTPAKLAAMAGGVVWIAALLAVTAGLISMSVTLVISKEITKKTNFLSINRTVPSRRWQRPTVSMIEGTSCRRLKLPIALYELFNRYISRTFLSTKRTVGDDMFP